MSKRDRVVCDTKHSLRGPSTFLQRLEFRTLNGARFSRSAHLPDCCLPKMPAPCPLSRGGRPRETSGISGVGILGTARPRIRRCTRSTSRRRTRPCGTRRESDGSRVHRRPERRVAVSGSLSSGIRESSYFSFKGRRTRATGLLHCRSRSLCTSGEQTDSDGIRPMSAVLGTGDVAPPGAPNRGRPGCGCDGGIPSRVAGDKS